MLTIVELICPPPMSVMQNLDAAHIAHQSVTADTTLAQIVALPDNQNKPKVILVYETGPDLISDPTTFKTTDSFLTRPYFSQTPGGLGGGQTSPGGLLSRNRE